MVKGMKPEEIVRALRCRLTSDELEVCEKANVGEHGCAECLVSYTHEAAALIEQLTAENTALLGYAKTIAGCSACKYEDRYQCYGDCDDCELGAPEDCVCKRCEHGSRWEWRGLPGALEKGDCHEPET